VIAAILMEPLGLPISSKFYTLLDSLKRTITSKPKTYKFYLEVISNTF